MRTFVIGSGFSLLLAASAGAQQRDSSYWTIGAGMGLVQGSRFATYSGRSAGTLQVEWRRFASRLGVRAEIGLSHRDQTFSYGAFQPCGGCSTRSRQSAATSLVSMVYEWRQGRVLRPYAVLGAGLERVEREWSSNYSYDGNTLTRNPEGSASTHMGMTWAGGLGVSANVQRVSIFMESRVRKVGNSPNEFLSIGFRIRPD